MMNLINPTFLLDKGNNDRYDEQMVPVIFICNKKGKQQTNVIIRIISSLSSAMTFDQSELAVSEEIKKIDPSTSRNPSSAESVGNIQVGFSTSGANSLATSRAGTRMTVRPDTSMSGATQGGAAAPNEVVKKTFHGALNGANIPMITELGTVYQMYFQVLFYKVFVYLVC